MSDYNLQYLVEMSENEEYNKFDYEKNKIVSVIDSSVSDYRHNFAFYLFPLLYSTCFITGSMVFLYKIINV